ncbi:MAG: S8 family serine peptidase [Chloroflexi bacterium]|nr:S8 family serine peptidase [Chloroflexota bacterium]
MKYSVIAKGITPDRVEAEIIKLGILDCKPARLLGQFFCDLSDGQATALSAVPGVILKPIKGYRVDQVLTEPPPVETLSDVFYMLRSYFAPPLTGTGLTVAVLDTGVRKTHQSLRNKVIYEANFTDSPSVDDVFGHGTQVAFVVAGGMHALGEKAGIAPGASIINIKVINDEGLGSDQDIVLGIDLGLAVGEHVPDGPGAVFDFCPLLFVSLKKDIRKPNATALGAKHRLAGWPPNLTCLPDGVGGEGLPARSLRCHPT